MKLAAISPELFDEGQSAEWRTRLAGNFFHGLARARDMKTACKLVVNMLAVLEILHLINLATST